MIVELERALRKSDPNSEYKFVRLKDNYKMQHPYRWEATGTVFANYAGKDI